MWKSLFHDCEYHAIPDVLVLLVICVHLLPYVEPFDHHLLPLHLALRQKVRAEYDLGAVDREHLKLVLHLVHGMLDLHLENADVVLPIRKLLLRVHQHTPAHLDLGQTRVETRKLRVVLRGRWQVTTPGQLEIAG